MMEPTPLRPPDEVAGGFLRVSLGGQARSLPILKIDHNRAWKELFNVTVSEALGGTRQLQTLDDVVNLLATSTDTMLDLLVAYDESGALGGKEWMDRNATDRDIYEALKKVTDAAFPFGVDLITRVPNFMGTLLEAVIRSSRSMSSSQPSTAGRQRRSKRPSPTSN